MGVFKGKFTGQPHIQLESLWFPIDFPLNQSFERFAIGPWPELDISRLRWVAGWIAEGRGPPGSDSFLELRIVDDRKLGGKVWGLPSGKLT